MTEARSLHVTLVRGAAFPEQEADQRSPVSILSLYSARSCPRVSCDLRFLHTSHHQVVVAFGNAINT
jgi:hypothetical protein